MGQFPVDRVLSGTLAGGHHESRTGAEDCVGVGEIALSGCDLSRTEARESAVRVIT